MRLLGVLFGGFQILGFAKCLGWVDEMTGVLLVLVSLLVLLCWVVLVDDISRM